MNFKVIRVPTIAGRQVVINVYSIDMILESKSSDGQCYISCGGEGIDVGLSVKQVMDKIKEATDLL